MAYFGKRGILRRGGDIRFTPRGEERLVQVILPGRVLVCRADPNRGSGMRSAWGQTAPKTRFLKMGL